MCVLTYRRGLRCCLFGYKGNTRASDSGTATVQSRFLLCLIVSKKTNNQTYTTMKTKSILFLLLLFSAAVFAQDVKRVAILETVDKENNISYANKLILRASLSKAITNTAGYEAYDRTDVDAIMSEQDFQRTGMVSNEQIKRLGEMTGANYILVAEAVVVDAKTMFITAKLLDVLDKYNVKATFFVIGAVDEKYAPMYQRIVEEGHSIGMHSYSHKYTEVYGSTEAFKEDFLKIQGLIKEKTGVECSIYRFPGGSSNSIGKEHIQEYIAYLEEENITYYDWNISSGDATGVALSVEDIVKNSTLELEKYNSAYILLHDSSTKRSTVEALPIIIETIQAMENTEIVPITEASVPVQQIIKE